MSCVSLGFNEIALELATKGAVMDTPNEADETAIHAAANRGSLKWLEIFHQKGLDMSPLNSNDQTPLDLVAKKPKCLAFLNSIGAKSGKAPEKK